MKMATFRVHVIEKQWGGFESDFYTYADGADAAEAMAAVEARCAAWTADSAELFGEPDADPVAVADAAPAAALLTKMRGRVAALPLAQLVEAFELTNAQAGEAVPVVRGVLMDELEARHPAAFAAWMDCSDPAQMDYPSRFFN